MFLSRSRLLRNYKNVLSRFDSSGGTASGRSIAKTKAEQISSQWYRDDIDGLRAIAIIAVVFYHFETGFPGGFAGVDVFFVISGYLVTSIQLRHLQDGTFDLRKFMVRRVRRLFWALAVMVTVVVIFCRFMFSINGYKSLLAEVQSVHLFSANFFYYVHNDNYFSDSFAFPLLHCWSLAVEEQYYFFYLFFLKTIWMCFSGHLESVLFTSLVVLFVLSLWLSVAWSGMGTGLNSVPDPDLFRISRGKFAFYLLPARVWEMALGGLCVWIKACCDRFNFRSWLVLKDVLAWIGLLMIAAAFHLLSAAVAYPGSAAALPCFGSAILICTCSQDRVSIIPSVGRLLSLKPLVAIGKISYSIYLWHWPVYILTQQEAFSCLNELQIKACGFCASIVVSVLSFHCVENFFRDSKRVPSTLFWTLTVGVWVGMLIFARSDAQRDRAGIPLHMATDISHSDDEINDVFTHGLLHASNFRSARGCNCFGSERRPCLPYLTDQEIDMLYDIRDFDVKESIQTDNDVHFKEGYDSLPKTIIWGSAVHFSHAFRLDAKDSILVIGDSHCMMFSGVIAGLSAEYNRSVSFVCEPHDAHLGRPLRFAERVLHHLKPQLIVFIFYHGLGSNPGEDEQMTAARHQDAIDAILSNHSSNILLIGHTPEIQLGNDVIKRYKNPKHSKKNLWLLTNITERWPQERQALNSFFRHASTNNFRVSFVDLAPYYLVEHESHSLVQATNPFTGRLDYEDMNHLTRDGALRAEQFFRWHFFGDAGCKDKTPFGSNHTANAGSLEIVKQKAFEMIINTPSPPPKI